MPCTPAHRTEAAPDIRRDLDDARSRIKAFAATMGTRRSIREFSPDPVPVDLIETAVEAAARAPSGANVQPWRFVLVSEPGVRAAVRRAAEAEEEEFYSRRATPEWLQALAPLGTDATKPFLTDAPTCWW